MFLKRVIAVDVAIVLTQRIFHSISGLITMLLIARFLSPEQQGWYYSFLSLAAVYTLFDHGLSVVLVPVFAQRFVDASLGDRGAIAGGDIIFAILGRATRWYAATAAVFVLILWSGGGLFFLSHGETPVNWAVPWATLVIASAGILLWMPFLALIEGSGRISEIYSLRLMQGILGAMFCWTALWSGAGVWAAVGSASAGALVPFVWIVFRRPLLLRGAITLSLKYDWRKEVWPLQWRVAVSWFCLYLSSQVYTPVLMKAQGPIIAGQLGLSLALANTLGFLAQSWIARRVPMLAHAAARNDWQHMKAAFRFDFIVFFAVYGLGSVVLLIIAALFSNHPFVARVLPFWQFACLLLVIFINQALVAIATYLRSFRREPLMMVTLITTMVSLPCAVYGAFAYSSGGVVLGLLGANVLVALPLTLWSWSRELSTLKLGVPSGKLE